jgi:hypothetical protein
MGLGGSWSLLAAASLIVLPAVLLARQARQLARPLPAAPRRARPSREQVGTGSALDARPPVAVASAAFLIALGIPFFDQFTYLTRSPPRRAREQVDDGWAEFRPTATPDPLAEGATCRGGPSPSLGTGHRSVTGPRLPAGTCRGISG